MPLHYSLSKLRKEVSTKDLRILKEELGYHQRLSIQVFRTRKHVLFETTVQQHHRSIKKTTLQEEKKPSMLFKVSTLRDLPSRDMNFI